MKIFFSFLTSTFSKITRKPSFGEPYILYTIENQTNEEKLKLESTIKALQKKGHSVLVLSRKSKYDLMVSLDRYRNPEQNFLVFA